MKEYILAHDIGTGSDKAVLVDFSGKIIAAATAPYPTFYPEPAWVEQNPEDSFYIGNVVIARQQRLKRNFRSKYWEVAIVHTKPLGDVPEDLMPEVKKPVQGT